MQAETAEPLAPTIDGGHEVHEVFFKTFIANQTAPSCINAQEAGDFCKKHRLDIFAHLHGLVHSPEHDVRLQAAQIMHHLGITAPILASKTRNKNSHIISDMIKDHFGPHQKIDTLRFNSFNSAYANQK